MTIVHGVPQRSEPVDVCVVGSGPAGLAVALTCEGNGLSVFVLEAGGEGKAFPAPDAFDVVDLATHADIETATRLRFGGTSLVWGGLCVPYDPIDFEGRSWVPAAAWPVTHAEMVPWVSRAASFLDCGTAFDVSSQDAAGMPGLDVGHLGRLARRASLSEVYRKRVAGSRLLTLCLRSRALDLVPDRDGSRIAGCEVATEAGVVRVRARHVVLAAGGLRSTAFLLRLARDHTGHPASLGPVLGRRYMGHLTGEIATIAFDDPDLAADYLYERDGEGRWSQRRIKLPPAVQRAEGLLNAAFTLRSPPMNDHGHRDGALSALSLLATVPGVTRAIGSKRLRGTVTEMRRGDRRGHLGNVLRHPASTVVGLGMLTYRSLVENLPMMTPNAAGRYSLRYHAEHAPHSDSRVHLKNGDDRELVVDFRYRDSDVDSVVRSHRLLDGALRAARIGRLEYHRPECDLFAAVRSQASDGYHQIGTASMASDPGSGVVDATCRVHGLANLHVASAAVLPTSGAANPTLATVAIALRVADHLCRETKGVGSSGALQPKATPSSLA